MLASLIPKLSAKIKVTFNCIESNIKDTQIEHIHLDDMYYSIGWKKFNKNKVLNTDHSLTIKVDIQLLAMYNQNGQPLSILEANEMLKESTNIDTISLCSSITDSEVISITPKSIKDKNKKTTSPSMDVVSHESDDSKEIIERMRMMEDKIDKYHQTVLSLKRMVGILSGKNNLENSDVRKEQNKVKLWLEKEVKLSQYFGMFILNGIDNMDTVKLISMDMLNEFGIEKIGHKIKILHHIKQLE